MAGCDKSKNCIFYVCLKVKLFIIYICIITGEYIRDLVTLESGGSGGVVWRIRSNATKLVCAVGSRNGTEETKLMVLDFDAEDNIPASVTEYTNNGSISSTSNAIALPNL